MPKRCARCGSLRRVREIDAPAGWLSYLESEREISPPVGTLKIPLCPECYSDAQGLLDGETEGRRDEFLDELDPAALIDEQT